MMLMRDMGKDLHKNYFQTAVVNEEESLIENGKIENHIYKIKNVLSIL
jgi:hypothetical protein